MSKVTGIIIAKNEEEMIGASLDSLTFCDQIVVVDTGSTDSTRELAEKKGAKVYTLSENDFAKIREFGASKVRTRWMFYLDADERVTENLANEIRSKIKDQNSNINAFRITRKNFYLGKHEWPTTEKLERLFLRSALEGWKGELHETAQVKGEIGELGGEILHYTHRDLASMVEKTNLWSEKEALLRLEADHPKMSWWRFPRVMLQAWYTSYMKEKGWKAGTAGLIESFYQMFSIFITYAKLWELQEKKK